MGYNLRWVSKVREQDSIIVSEALEPDLHEVLEGLLADPCTKVLGRLSRFLGYGGRQSGGG